MLRERARIDLTFVLGWLLLQAAFSCSASASSAQDEKKNGPYHGQMMPVTAHTTWLERDGAPTNIAAIAQTTDGFLWLGTPSGLFRFDGAQFVSYPVTSLSSPLPSNGIGALLADREGGLWIGYHSGGISHLRASGAVENYPAASGSSPNSTQKFVYGVDGTLWAIGDYHLYRLRSGSWVSYGKTHGLPDEPLFTLFVDRSGTIWASTRGHLFSMQRQENAFRPYPTSTFIVGDMVQMPNGEIWISDAWRTIRPLNPSANRNGWPVNGYVRMAVEKNGNLWLAQDYRGVSHRAWSPLSPLIKEQGLTSEQTDVIFVDQENNIWVGTPRGLDRFHSTQVKQVSNTRVEYYPALCAAPQKGVWIATLARPIVYASNDRLRPYGKDVGSSSIVCRDDGTVWMVDPIAGKLTGWVNGRMIRIDTPPDAHLASEGNTIGLDRDGALLITFRPYGLWRFDGSWSRVTDSGLPHEEPASIFRDSQQRVWLGYENGTIGLRDDSGGHTFLSKANNNLGKVMAFTSVNGRIFAAGTNGLSYFGESDFHKISLARQGVLRGVSGFVQDHEGNLWLNTSAGLYRILRNQLSSTNPNDLEYERFDDRQGILGSATQGDPVPSLVLDKAGPLWVSTAGSVLEIDPDTINQHPAHPRLVIERVLLNGKVIGDREHPVGRVTFTGTKLKELEIDYAGVDLSAPEKMRYRYMMAGKSSAWQDVGERRQAFYDHLSPGHYSFRVAESNDMGQWTEADVSLSIDVRPAFYETYWFRIILSLTVSGILYLAYTLRVLTLTNALKTKLQERANERLRISRELHDTLLQSIHGLMLRFHFATSELPDNEPAKKPLQLALERADAAFLEARQRIELLRDEVPDEAHFNQQLFEMAQGLDVQSRLDFSVSEEGEPRLIVGRVQTELCRIAREALINTLNHASATKVRISLSYSASQLRMCCSDNGIGIPQEIIRAGRRSGHWGLVGIAERAATIDGLLSIRSDGDRGTDLEISVPARRAYRRGATFLQRLPLFSRSKSQETQT